MKLGVCYYPEHWPEAMWAEDAREMVETGISWVRVGEFAWSRYEPVPGHYEWGWLARALDTLGKAGLKVILGTPTATPPKWLIDQCPDILAYDEEGQPRGFGSRRHYCFSSQTYREHSQRIFTEMAQRFGAHPAVHAWQTDNEYGCHDTILSYSPVAAVAFRDWCSHKYGGDIEKLNTAWGNVFWSMEYRSFAEIDLPNLTVTEANPAHQLDFWRFSSDQVVSYNRMQVEVLRQYSPGRELIHNYMGCFTDFDHHAVGEDLDVASWDSYPLGFLDLSNASVDEKMQWMRTGHPDFAAFHHDLYRGVGKGRMWVMEQQPGPVNWAAHNPAPLPGMVRFWSWEAFAHGAEVVSYFRWRQAPFAQEQMHSGLKRSDNSADLAQGEVRQTRSEVDQLAEVSRLNASTADNKAMVHKEVALIFDYHSDWSLRIQPHGANYRPLDQVMALYTACRHCGVNIDIVPPHADLSGYAVIIVANQQLVNDVLLHSIQQLNAEESPPQIIFGPRTFSKTQDYQTPDKLPPGPLQSLMPIRVERVESLSDHYSGEVSNGEHTLTIKRWWEMIAGDLQPAYQNPAKQGFLYQHHNMHYFNACLDQNDLNQLFRQILETNTSLTLCHCEGGLRQQKHGQWQYFFNYGPEAQSLPTSCQPVLGGVTLQQGELAILSLHEQLNK